MFFSNGRSHFKKKRIATIIVIVLFIFCVVGYYVLGYTGLIYMKNDEGKKVYEFIEDMNGDGKKENVKFVNHYYSYYQKNTCDSAYTRNNLKIYIDGEEMYCDSISTLGPLLNPKIVDLVEENIKKKQIYIHANGGGPAVPMDYFFYIKKGKVVVSSVQSGF